MMTFLKSLFGAGADTALDNDLIERILDNLKIEPSEQLREMLAQSSTGKWSQEAVQAAHLLLDRREKNIAPEPVYRTVPRTENMQALRNGEAVAPGFSRHLLALDWAVVFTADGVANPEQSFAGKMKKNASISALTTRKANGQR